LRDKVVQRLKKMRERVDIERIYIGEERVVGFTLAILVLGCGKRGLGAAGVPMLRYPRMAQVEE
jgi:hypothetical protein